MKYKSTSELFSFYSFRPYLFLLLFLTLILIFIPCSKADSSSEVSFRDGTFFPITRYRNPDPHQTGSNNYYAMDDRPKSKKITITASGQEDLLTYENGTFKVQRTEPLLYHRDIQWVDNGNFAYIVSSRLPPDTGGAILKYNPSTKKVSLLKKTPVNLLGLAIFEDDRLLTVGGQRIPDQKGVLYRLENSNLRELKSPSDVVFHGVDWNKHADVSLIVGEQGTVASWKPGEEAELHEIAGNPFLNTVEWHPNGKKALIGGEKGGLYRYKNGNITKISLNMDWTIQDIAWHPSGDYAAVVGGIGAGDRGYWAHYQDLSAETIQFSKPFFSVEWMDQNNAILGGQKVLWRYSTSKTPEDFGLSASLSVSHQNPEESQKITLSGFGSTYRGNADSVARYLFRYDTGDTSGWQNHPDNTIRYFKSGVYTPSVSIKAGNERTVDSDTVTVRVGTTKDANESTHSYVSYLIYTLIPLGILLVLGFLFWQDHRE